MERAGCDVSTGFGLVHAKNAIDALRATFTTQRIFSNNLTASATASRTSWHHGRRLHLRLNCQSRCGWQQQRDDYRCAKTIVLHEARSRSWANAPVAFCPSDLPLLLYAVTLANPQPLPAFSIGMLQYARLAQVECY